MKRNFLVITDLPDQHCLQVDSDFFVKYLIPEGKKAVHDQTQTFILPTMTRFSTTCSQLLFVLMELHFDP